MAQDQVVIVTGASMGIGRHIAHTFAAEGAKVALADIAPMEGVAIELREMGVEVLAIPTDVRDEGEVQNMVEQVIAQFGRIDVLVNNAGIVPHFAWGVPRWPRLTELDQSFWDRVIGTNLGGTFLCTKHVLRQMEAQRSGHVVNLHGGSGVGSTGTAYAVSKDAIRTFTRYAAGEARESNVCVVAVAPGGGIATENAPEEARTRMPAPDSLENAFVLAAQLPLELSGETVQLKDGKLVVMPW